MTIAIALRLSAQQAFWHQPPVSDGACTPRKSWQNVSQKCMKPRGYRGVVPFDTFENPTKINKDIKKSMSIILQIVHRKV